MAERPSRPLPVKPLPVPVPVRELTPPAAEDAEPAPPVRKLLPVRPLSPGRAEGRVGGSVMEPE